MSEFVIDAEYLARQKAFSLNAFGPAKRTAGVIAHIKKELVEIEAEPDNASEWADLIILAFDGAMRRGPPPQEILDAVINKLKINEQRRWPDWRGLPEDVAIEHVKED